MKKIIIAIIIAIASAMSSNAQVLTSETIKNVYETVSHQQKSDFVFNAEWTANDITTVYIYKKVTDRNGILMLKPHLKYEYAYAADGTLTSRVAYRQSDSQDWMCTGRHDYTLDNGLYFAEYSRYNRSTNSFDEPVEKMVYMLAPNDGVDYVGCYHRELPTAPYQIVSETAIAHQSLLLAEK